MKAFYPAIIIVLLLLNSCKKDKILSADANTNGTTPVATVPLPDSTLFVGGQISDTTTIYVLNASTGSLVTKYSYKRVSAVPSMPYADNGLLYSVEGNNIRALKLNTGEAVWKDSLSTGTYNQPVLHNDTFYGVCTGQSSGTFAYALDATKQSDKFLWQYALTGNGGINYNNGIIYISTANALVALDAKSGTLNGLLMRHILYPHQTAE